MNRLQLSALLMSATALLLLTPSPQAIAYDGHFDYRQIESPYRAGDYYRGPRYCLPVNRFGCGYREDRNDIPQQNQFRARDRFIPGYPLAAPAPRRGYGFHQPNFQQASPQNYPQGRQVDPFEKYAPRQSRPQENHSTPSLPTMELPPSILENLKKETPSASHSHSHDHGHSHNHGNSEPANPSTNSDQNRENNSPFMQPTLPRINPPSARFLVPSGS